MKEAYRGNTDRANRLYAARTAAGFKSSREAAVRFGWPPATYRAHETANMNFDEATARVYANAFGVSAAWLFRGQGRGPPTDEAREARFEIRKASARDPADGPAGRLRVARRLSGYRSVTEAAEAVGIGRSTLSAHETGQNEFPRDAAVLYGRAFGVEPDWLLTGRFPSGLQASAEAYLKNLLALHRMPDGQVISDFRHIVRPRPPAFRKEDQPDRSVPKVDERTSSGDIVPEYTPFALYRVLSDAPGGVPSGEWSFPKDYLSVVLGCDPSETIVLSVPRTLPEIAAGGRLVIDKGNLIPPTAAYVALVRDDGTLAIARSHVDDLTSLEHGFNNMKIAGKICAFLSSADPLAIRR
jgi:transcriptional regulator with XRE-family HTH domain